MAVIRDIVFDCAHPAALARFWAEALDTTPSPRTTKWSSPGSATPGSTGRRTIPPCSWKAHPAARACGSSSSPSPKRVKNRVHLDLAAGDTAAEVGRLLRLGATERHRTGSRVTMADPEGNEFCIDGA